MDVRRKGSRMTPEEIEALQKKNEELTAKLADAGKGADEVLRTENENLAKLNKELITGRDAAKEKTRKAEEEALAKNGEYQTLSEKLQKENDDLLKQLGGNKEVIDGYTARDEARLATLLETVHADFKETISDETLPLATRLALAEKHASVKPGGPNPRPGGDTDNDTKTRAEFDAMSHVDRSEYARKGGKVTDG